MDEDDEEAMEAATDALCKQLELVEAKPMSLRKIKANKPVPQRVALEMTNAMP